MEAFWIAGLLLIAVTAAYVLMTLWFGSRRLVKQAPVHQTKELPFVSVVITARNEENTIRSCLEGILSQDYPHDRLEIVLSDDHSDDRTVEVASGIRNPLAGPEIRILTAGTGLPSGKKPALARAIQEARGNLILATDADTSRGPGWVHAMVQEYLRSGKQMILGPVCLKGNSIFQRIQQLEFLGVMGLTAGSAGAGTPIMCNGANLLYPKTTYLKAGGFDGHMKYSSGDDQFLLASVRKLSGRSAVAFALREEAIVSTPAEDSISGFLHQRMRWVSKSKGYRDPLVILSGGLAYLTSAFLLAFLVTGLFDARAILLFLICWGAKILADFALIQPMARFFGNRNDLWLYLPAQLFQLIYVPLAGLAGLIFPYRWKGRRIRA